MSKDISIVHTHQGIRQAQYLEKQELGRVVLSEQRSNIVISESTLLFYFWQRAMQLGTGSFDK